MWVETDERGMRCFRFSRKKSVVPQNNTAGSEDWHNWYSDDELSVDVEYAD